MKKNAARTSSQVKPSGPLLATAPSVSTPTSVQIRKKSMSKRPKCFLSLDFSSSAACVSAITTSVACGSSDMTYITLNSRERWMGPPGQTGDVNLAFVVFAAGCARDKGGHQPERAADHQ